MPYKTSPRMAARKAERRRLLVETALRLFARHGYHAATVPMITREARSSTGTFYMYFRNKEDVFAAGLEDIGERLSAALNQEIALHATSRDQMAAVVERLVGWLAENPTEARVLVVDSAGLGGRLEKVRRALIDSHTKSVASAIRSNSGIDSAEAGILARCWVGSALEAVDGWLRLPHDERPDASFVAKVVKRFNLRGIGAAS